LNKGISDGLAPRCKECDSDRKFKAEYGVGIQWFNNTIEKQGNKCYICGKPYLGSRVGFNIDHNHLTGKVRGILCRLCNLALGHFRDDIRHLESAILYLVGSQRAEVDVLGRPGSNDLVFNSCRWFRQSLNLNQGVVQKMWDDQGGRCKICLRQLGSSKSAHLDHCHSSGKVRGLLCFGCNCGLGLFRDKVQDMTKAVEYLRAGTSILGDSWSA
jgi:hypothetical protein